MAQTIDNPAYRNRHTFSSQTTTTWQATVGGYLDDGVTPITVGSVSVGDEHIDSSGSYGYRDRFIFASS